MIGGEFRTWLAGYLEGLAGRELPAAQIDALIRRFEASFQGVSASAPSVSETPTAPPADAKALVEALKKNPRKAKAPVVATTENVTPVAETPPYDPEAGVSPVVRLG